MNHDEARTLASALADGELDAAGNDSLSAHLVACAECGGFLDEVRSLSRLAAALPAEAVPEGLAGRLAPATAVGPPGRSPARRRTVLAFAAALAIGLFAVFGGLPFQTFELPAAEAARALGRITSFEMQREVTDFAAPDETRTVVEKIWFRAPGLLRIERRVAGRLEIEIRRPGERYVKTAGTEYRETGLPPDVNPVPESLSPTIAILGERLGPGPEVAGRATVRYGLRFGPRERRTALVDATSLVVLGGERFAVLGKETTVDGRLVERKRTISVRYNPPVPDNLFAVPSSVRPADRGFRVGGIGVLAAPPAAVPEETSLVRAGAGPEGGAALFIHGAFGVLVTVDAPASRDDDATVWRAARVSGRDATLVLSLFDVPRVLFAVGSHTVVVAAPLPPDQLVALASAMYPAE